MSVKRSILREMARADGLNRHQVKEVTTYGQVVVEAAYTGAYKNHKPEPAKEKFIRPKGFHTKLVKGKVVKCS